MQRMQNDTVRWEKESEHVRVTLSQIRPISLKDVRDYVHQEEPPIVVEHNDGEGVGGHFVGYRLTRRERSSRSRASSW